MNNNSWFKKEKPMLALPGLGGGSASNIYWRPVGGSNDPTYVDDVFSTYLYEGNGTVRNFINNGIKLGNTNAGNSVDFNGSSDYLSIPDSTDFDLASVDFTMECWYYPRSNPTWVGLLAQWPNGNYNTTNSWTLEPVGSQLNFYYCMTNGTLSNIAAPGTLSTNQWHHCAIVKKNNQLKCFLNGSGSSWSTINGTLQNSTEPLTIGGLVAPSSGSGWADGLISNVRITKGQCLYENNFTPSTEPLTTTSQGATASNVKLLCCQSSTITGATVIPVTSNSILPRGNPKPSSGPFTASDGKGGMVWIKSRTSTQFHTLVDTARGPTKGIFTNHDMGEDTGTNGYMTSFDNNGFTTGNYGNTNYNGTKFASWTFRKAPGFFDVVTISLSSYSTNQRISHSLGCIPGLILLKNTNNTEDWRVYHRDLGRNKYLTLNGTGSATFSGDAWGTADPTSTDFGFNTTNLSVGMPSTYVAYVFAGGESTDATARSVNFNGVVFNQRLDIADTTDLEIGSSEFTMECWFRQDEDAGSGSDSHTLLSKWDNDGRKEFIFRITSSGGIQCLHWLSSSNGSSNDANLYGNTRITNGTWNHAAVTRDSNGKIRMFLNGLLQTNMGTQSSTHANSHEFMIGANGSSGVEQYMSGNISNVRFIKGQCLWTSSFRPTNEPLTTTSQGATASNVKLLCCNGSSTTSSTVTPATITAFNNPTASTDNPFDHTGCFKFGDDGSGGIGNESIVKCGSYTGSGGENEVFLGWEPQYIFFKNSDASYNWRLYDSMRGVVTDGTDPRVSINLTDAEDSTHDKFELTATGFRVLTTDSDMNGTNNKIIYFAIRRPDGYVGKTPTFGTEVFSTGKGNSTSSSSSNATFVSGFPVDWALRRMPAGGSGIDMDWVVYDRLVNDKYLRANTRSIQMGSSRAKWDSNTGFNHTDNDTYQAWMWKRQSSGMDVVHYRGDGLSMREIAHNLNAVPEMIMLKIRDRDNYEWCIGHKGMNGGTNPWEYIVHTNNDDPQQDAAWVFVDTPPTSTHFILHSDGYVNRDGNKHVAVLFASVPGISKCGHYTGNGSNSGPVITLGFKPRLIIIKRTDASGHWVTYDTTRGLGGTGINDIVIYLDSPNAQTAGYDYFDMVGSGATAGFQHIRSDNSLNATNGKYIYYAHA